MYSLLASALSGGRLLVLIFHRVLERPDPLRGGEVDAATFRWQMEQLRRHFKVLPLDEAISGLSEGSLPRRAACITFDDGYADNVTLALPILQDLGLPATFFIATGFLDGGRMWNDTVIEAIRGATGELDLADLGLKRYVLGSDDERRAAVADVLGSIKYRALEDRESVAAAIAERSGVSLPDGLMMNSRDVAVLANAGMTIGGHTVNHPILKNLSLEQARAEILDGKARLEQLAGKPVTVFAYPNGKPGEDYERREVELLRDCGFAGAVTTAWGVGSIGGDLFQLPRFTPWDRTPGRFVLRLLHNYARTQPQVVRV
jgi:peptidoglycan/xylan/chitin deacetylase (PgdA/CDA1 family)